jgi:hypothetical protein
MSAVHRFSAALLVSVGLTACGSANDAPQEPPPPAQETVLGDMVGTMDKARAVEGTMMQHKEKLDRTLDGAENAAKAGTENAQ